MNVTVKNKLNGTGKYYVLEFYGEEDVQIFDEALATASAYTNACEGFEEDAIRIDNFRKLMESRISDKYAHDDVTHTAALFIEEMGVMFPIFLYTALHADVLCAKAGDPLLGRVIKDSMDKSTDILSKSAESLRDATETLRIIASRQDQTSDGETAEK